MCYTYFIILQELESLVLDLANDDIIMYLEK